MCKSKLTLLCAVGKQAAAPFVQITEPFEVDLLCEVAQNLLL
jgi:hypothetical protein